MRTLLQLLLALALAPVITAPASVAAQAAPAEPSADQSIFSDTIDIHAINVEVVVTDRKGNRVSGLAAADFRLLVDGKPYPLDYFGEVRDGEVIASPDVPPPPEASTAREAARAMPPTPPAPPTPPTPPTPPPPPAVPGEKVGNNYLIFVDEFFSPIPLRNEALRWLTKELESLPAEDRIALVTFDGRNTHVLTPWTQSRATVVELFQKISRRKGSIATSGLTLGSLEPAATKLLEVYNSNLSRTYEGLPNPLLAEAEAQSRFELVMIDRAVSAGSAALRAFAAAPGRKIMLLLSGGWRYDQTAISGVNWDRIQRMMNLPDGAHLLKPLIDTANLLGFTVYPLHLSGGPDILPSAAEAGHDVRDNSFGFEGSSAIGYALAQTSLVLTADETGGKLLLPGNNHHLAKIAADTRSYYWLGFTHSGDDRRRSLAVEVLRKGLRVRSRSSFVPLSHQARAALEVESALMTGEAPGMAELQVSAGSFQKVGSGRGELPITLRIPVDQIALIPRDGRHVAQLELRIAALDDGGDRSDVPTMPIQISSPSAPQPNSFVTYEAKLRVRNRAQDLQFVLYDLLSGKSFTKRLRVAP